jgi:hypothetical protein
MAVNFPRKMEDITNEWLSTVLGRTVTGYKTMFLEGGVLSEAFKLYAITYDDDAGGAPSSVVIKVANRVKERSSTSSRLSQRTCRSTPLRSTAVSQMAARARSILLS